MDTLVVLAVYYSSAHVIIIDYKYFTWGKFVKDFGGTINIAKTYQKICYDAPTNEPASISDASNINNFPQRWIPVKLKTHQQALKRPRAHQGRKVDPARLKPPWAAIQSPV
jgi:hypothetical protein